MAESGMSLTGDWEGTLRRLEAFPDRLKKELQLATRQNAVGLEGEIKKGIVSQAPGGEQYTPLHPFTILMREKDKSYRGLRRDVHGKFLKRGSGGGDHKALLDHGDLYGSVTHKILPDGLSAIIGINRHAQTGDGKSVVDIARIVFYGAVIPVTPKLRVYLHVQGFHLSPNTTHIVIPPRRTIEPAYKAYVQTIQERYIRAVKRAASARA
jgi:hypothetical protein